VPRIRLPEQLFGQLILNMLKIKMPSEVPELVNLSKNHRDKNIGYLKLAAAEIINGSLDVAFGYIVKTDRIGYTIIQLIDELILTIQTPKQFEQFR
jgi:hypothetical protein